MGNFDILTASSFKQSGNKKLLWLGAIFTLLSIAAFVLVLFNIDISTRNQAYSFEIQEITQSHHIDLHQVLLSFVDTLFDLASLGLLLFVFVALIFNISISRKPQPLVLGTALLGTALLQLFHYGIAIKFFTGVSNYLTLTPFTWWLSRMYASGALLLALFAIGLRHYFRLQTRVIFYIVTAIALLFPAIWVMYGSLAHSHLLQTFVMDKAIHRPFEWIPLALFLMATYALWRYYKHAPSYFLFALLLSMGPNIGIELVALFDDKLHFFGEVSYPHILFILSGVLILIGITMDNLTFHTQLQKSTKTAVNASINKNKFISTLSYELRTPLLNLLGYVKCMQDGYDGPLTKEQEASLARMSEASNEMADLVEEIADITKIEEGKILLNFNEVNLCKEMQACIEGIRGEFDAKRVVLSCVQPENHFFVYLDQKRLRQVILELLHNALTYTQEGTVQVAGKQVGEEVQIHFQDNGEVISEREREKIFDPYFTKGDQNSHLGLGLTLTKRIVEEMGGTITLQESSKTRTDFVLTFPLRRVE